MFQIKKASVFWWGRDLWETSASYWKIKWEFTHLLINYSESHLGGSNSPQIVSSLSILDSILILVAKTDVMELLISHRTSIVLHYKLRCLKPGLKLEFSTLNAWVLYPREKLFSYIDLRWSSAMLIKIIKNRNQLLRTYPILSSVKRPIILFFLETSRAAPSLRDITQTYLILQRYTSVI